MEFVAGAAANRQLQQVAAGQHLQAAPHGAGVAVAGTKPLLPEIGMGIQLHQHQIGMLVGDGGHGAGADRMLTAQHQGVQTQIEHRRRGLLHGVHDRFRCTEGDVYSTEIGIGQILQIQIHLGPSAFISGGRRSVERALDGAVVTGQVADATVLCTERISEEREDHARAVSGNA